jgi:hypothetical protein
MAPHLFSLNPDLLVNIHQQIAEADLPTGFVPICVIFSPIQLTNYSWAVSQQQGLTLHRRVFTDVDRPIQTTINSALYQCIPSPGVRGGWPDDPGPLYTQLALVSLPLSSVAVLMPHDFDAIGNASEYQYRNLVPLIVHNEAPDPPATFRSLYVSFMMEAEMCIAVNWKERRVLLLDGSRNVYCRELEGETRAAVHWKQRRVLL